MFKILIPAIFLMGNAFAEFNISNIKLTPTELEIVGDSLEEIKSVAIISNDSRKDFEINNVTSNQVNASPLDNTTLNEWRVLNLVISDSEKESTYPITISQKNGLITFYKLQEKETPVVKSPNKMVLDQINFVPGENNTGYDYNYSLYANPTGDFAIKGIDKDLFTIDNEGNVEISGTLKIKGKQIGFNIPYLPIKEQTIPSNSANKVVFSAGESKELVESGYTIPMNICPKGQILKSDGINFVCSLEASQEDQLGPVYTSNKSNFGVDQIYRELQINNLGIDQFGNITGALNFTSLGIMDVATATFHVTPGTGVGIGIAAPTVKLDILGANNSGIKLKQGAKIGAINTTFSNGMVFEDSASTKGVGIGYGSAGASDTLSIISFNGSSYNQVFSIDGAGNGIVLGNLKIGAYTLPATDGGAGQVLKTNGSGAVSWSPAATGNAVNGPATSTLGNVAAWNSADGTLLADTTKAVANLVTNSGVSTTGAVAFFPDAAGKIIQSSTKLETDLVTAPAAASNTNNLAAFTAPGVKTIKDSGIVSTDVMTMSGVPATGGMVLQSVPASKSVVESTTLVTNLVTMSTASTAANQVLLSAAAGKTTQATSYTFPAAGGVTGQVLAMTATGTANWATVGGGDVTGPSSAGDNELAVFNGTTGKIIKNVNITHFNVVTASTAFGAANKVALSASGNKDLIVTPYTFPTGNGTSGYVLKTDGAGAVTWQPDVAVGTNTVQNLGTSTDNAIPRFVLATGKEIENSVVTIGNAGELAGVLSINGKTAADLLTVNATPTSDDRILLSTSGTKIMKVSPYTMPATCGANQILKADATGLIITCMPDSGGVASVFNRTGAVVAVAGDYNAGQVNSTPTVNIVATNVQAAIAELDIEKLALAGGTMTGGLIIGSASQPVLTIGNAGGSAGELRLLENGNTDWVGFKAPGTLAGNIIWILPDVIGASGTVLSNDGGGVLSWKASSGGDVVGPGSSTSGNLASFSGTGGKTLADSGVLATNVVQGPATASATAVAVFSNGTGKLIQASTVSIDALGNMSGVGNIGSSGSLTVNGTLTVNGSGSFSGPLTAQSYTNTSDRKLKKDIAPFSGGDLIDKLMPVTFRWKKGDDRPVIGLIAQDVEKVLPDVITITKTKDGSIRSYDVGQVLALTIEALKETRAEVKMLQEKIRKLEQKKR